MAQDVFPKIGTSKTLSDQIEQKIEEAIREKKLSAGQRLPTEIELCKKFGVSRTVLREALQRLHSRGLIQKKKRSGIYVNDYSSSQANRHVSLYFDLNFDQNYVLHLMHVRQMMEPQIAKLAAKNRSAEDLIFLEKNIARFRDRAQDSSILAQLDLEFHSRIIDACGNPIIKVILEPVYSQLPKVKILIVKHVKSVSDTAHIYHERIFEMIKQQNGQGALEAMTAHLEVAERDALALYRSLKQFNNAEVD